MRLLIGWDILVDPPVIDGRGLGCRSVLCLHVLRYSRHGKPPSVTKDWPKARVILAIGRDSTVSRNKQPGLARVPGAPVRVASDAFGLPPLQACRRHFLSNKWPRPKRD